MLIYNSKLRFCLIDLVETPHARHCSSKLDTALTLSVFSQALNYEFLEVPIKELSFHYFLRYDVTIRQGDLQDI